MLTPFVSSNHIFLSTEQLALLAMPVEGRMDRKGAWDNVLVYRIISGKCDLSIGLVSIQLLGLVDC